MQFGFIPHFHWFFCTSLALLIVAFLWQHYDKRPFYFKKFLFIASVSIALFSMAFETAYLYDERNDPEHYSHFVDSREQGIIAEVSDVPVIKSNWIKIALMIKCLEKDGYWNFAKGNTIVYVKRDEATDLQIGKTIYLKSKFSYVNGPNNPHEFDYKKYLEYRNVYHMLYCDAEEISVVKGFMEPFSPSQVGTRIKAATVDILRRSGLSKNAFAICSALLVGYDDEIDSEVMQSFSHSGTLHVLSVSGMHTGILYLILNFMFSVFDKHNRHKKLKCFFVIICLALFVLITGFSPAVLRAALMLTLIQTGQTFYRQGNSYNTLLFSAFLLLLIKPYLLLDIGVLLSYLAVFGIMYLHPVLSNVYFVENKILRWFWNMILMSVAATLFTLPVCLYYFHQFPVWFIFSNLVIIPLSIGIMFGAIALICFSKITFIKTLLVFLIDKVNDLMLWVAQLTDNESFGFIDGICFSATDALFCSVFICLLLIVIYSKQYKHVIYMACICIMWLLASFYELYESSQKSELIVFHIKKTSVYALRNGNTVYANFDGIEPSEYTRHIKPYLLSIPDLQLIDNQGNLINTPEASVYYHNRSDINLSELATDYVIVANNAMPGISAINAKNKPMIIADCSNSYTFVKKLKKQCEENHLAFYSVKENGAFLLDLKK